MIPSRPKGQLNHGTPANGYGPCAVRVVIIDRSAAERSVQALTCPLEE